MPGSSEGDARDLTCPVTVRCAIAVHGSGVRAGEQRGGEEEGRRGGHCEAREESLFHWGSSGCCGDLEDLRLVHHNGNPGFRVLLHFSSFTVG